MLKPLRKDELWDCLSAGRFREIYWRLWLVIKVTRAADKTLNARFID